MKLIISLSKLHEEVSLLLLILLLSIQIESFNIAQKNFTKYENASNDGVPRVHDGWPATDGQVPYQIALKMYVRRHKTYVTFCGAALVSEVNIISAAHCFKEDGSNCCNRGQASKKVLSRMYAVAGLLVNQATLPTQETSTSGQWRKLQFMLYPSSFRFPKDDISIGRVTRKYNINHQVSPIPYTTRHADYKGICAVSGFGRTSNTAAKGSEVLLIGHLQLVSARDCSRIHRRNMQKMICTNSFYSDVNKGDSGGPLVCTGTRDPKETEKGILVGIVSGGHPTRGSFFTRVSSHTRFLRSKDVCNSPSNALISLFLLMMATKTISSQGLIGIRIYSQPRRVQTSRLNAAESQNNDTAPASSSESSESSQQTGADADSKPISPADSQKNDTVTDPISRSGHPGYSGGNRPAYWGGKRNRQRGNGVRGRWGSGRGGKKGRGDINNYGGTNDYPEYYSESEESGYDYYGHHGPEGKYQQDPTIYRLALVKTNHQIKDNDDHNKKENRNEFVNIDVSVQKNGNGNGKHQSKGGSTWNKVGNFIKKTGKAVVGFFTKKKWG